MTNSKNVQSLFPFFCDQGKNVDLENILKINISGLKFKKGKNVEL